VTRGYLLSHLRISATFCMCNPDMLLIVLALKGCCFGGRKVLFLVMGEVVGDFAAMCIVAFLLERLRTYVRILATFLGRDGGYA
jgi:hypothetical protein